MIICQNLCQPVQEIPDSIEKKRYRPYVSFRNTNVVLDLELLFSIFGLYTFAMNFDVDLSGRSELRVVEEPIQDSGSI